MEKKTDINKKFEARHLANINANQKRIQEAYAKAIKKIFDSTGSINLKSKTFRLSDYPILNKVVNEALIEFHGEVMITLVNGIRYEWQLSGEKFENIVAATYKGEKISAATRAVIADPRTDALEAFIARKTAGLTLSDRVWRYTNQFQAEIEQGLYTGISAGQSAAAMARDQQQYLVNPDKLFRGVKDADGKLVLSKAAKKYKPGQGVYRSSYKNAYRMTRDVINDSYREADNERWDATPFVLGFEVRLSNNHPKHDICDYLAGLYPTSFKWTKWHIQCICYVVPVMASPAAFNEYERAVLGGSADKYQFKGRVSDMPANFTSYVKENAERFENWKRKPEWLAN
ncbi:hypothetical protein GCM10023149_48560 [Mucilaginibacter gynuensis]|uniref:Uncharacterized protein n=1 Tax=Mucilaginibacter gynuensis TaxID=1302236 RepID=A0ABP8HF78_9SPHI